MQERWSFDNDYLFDLVVANRKHGTCALYQGNNNMAKVGEINTIYNSQGREVKIKITNVKKCRFCDIDEKWAQKEGEGDLSLEYWQKVHIDFFRKLNPDFKTTDMLELNEFVVIE